MSREDKEALQAKIEKGLAEERKQKKKEQKRRLREEQKEFRVGFRKFITKGDVIELAVAVVLGTAFNKIVNSLVADVLTPVISYALRGVDMTDWKKVLAEGTEEASEIAIRYGNVIQAVINFILIGFMLYLIVRVFNRIRGRINQLEKEIMKKKAEAERLEAEAKKKEEEIKAAEEKLAREKIAEEERRIREEQHQIYVNSKEEKEILLQIRDALWAMRPDAAASKAGEESS